MHVQFWVVKFFTQWFNMVEVHCLHLRPSYHSLAFIRCVELCGLYWTYVPFGYSDQEC